MELILLPLPCNHNTSEKYNYDAAVIQVGINDILRCKNDEKLKELSNDIMKITHTCQEYIIRKVFISSIVTCTKTFANIAKIDEDMKNMHFK